MIYAYAFLHSKLMKSGLFNEKSNWLADFNAIYWLLGRGLKENEVDLYSAYQLKFHLARLDSTRLDTFDVSSPCILAVSS